ncbi:universal stress protein [Natronolimnohabitans innermongolicus]|uniref:UspA domain-containing protein n=1 Tax=Natronolimnohabitans innermongolicus JCM 12255 TaxID=1227499 RepID=L9WIC8_9EURY|nr:universal stress protein [Natronolimnohabitans innermongolicus]ELY49204.1 UspA domain-containing protein [Natronolimnohabitans innermongolicus JCM 12255]
MTLAFDGTVIVPAADPDDGERTARGLIPHLTPTTTVVLVNVIEKGGGTPDKAPMDRRREYAEEIFERMRGVLEETDTAVETDVLLGTDIVERIFDEADERGADAVVFNPRKGNRLAELLTGDVARRMVKEASIPVVALPQQDS